MPLYLFGEEPGLSSTVYSYDNVYNWNDWTCAGCDTVNEIVKAAVKMVSEGCAVNSPGHYYFNLNRNKDDCIEIGPSQLWIGYNSIKALSYTGMRYLPFVDTKVLTATRTQRNRVVSMDKTRDQEPHVMKKIFEAMKPFVYGASGFPQLNVAVHIADVDNITVDNKGKVKFDILEVKEYGK